MNIDDLLPSLSRQNFYYLESSELRIIKIIAESKPLNLSELGNLTKKYTSSFDRWGVVKRLEGTTQFRGLIRQNYVYKFTINKKESKYGLTVKGLLAALRVSIFDKIHLVREYREFLKKYTLDEKKLRYVYNYIKYEIAFLLYHNKLQEVDWTRFRYLKLYLENRKNNLRYPDNFLNLEIEPYFWLDPLTGELDPEREKYDSIRQAYYTAYRSCYNYIGLIKPEEVYDKLVVKSDTSQQIKSKIMETVVLNMGATLWYKYIDSFELKSKIVDMVEDYIQINAKKPYQYWPRAIHGDEVKNRILSIGG